jgi:hypothetical protein
MIGQLRKTVRQLLVFETLPKSAAAVPDDQVNVVWGDVATPHIAVIIIFAVKRADGLLPHAQPRQVLV